MWQLQAAALTGWAVHGLHLGYPNLVIPNLISVAGAVLVLGLIRRDRSIPLGRLLWLPLVVAVALIGIEFIAPGTTFGIAATIPLAIGVLAQSRDLISAPDISGVSPVFLALLLLTQVLWLGWSLLIGDVAVTVSGATLGALCTFNLVQYRRRTAAAAAQAPDAVVPDH